jgi:Family of unknown function (DUF5989)
VSFLSEFLEFMVERKKLWLLPLVIVMLIFGAIGVMTKGTVIAPFIYTVF